MSEVIQRQELDVNLANKKISKLFKKITIVLCLIILFGGTLTGMMTYSNSGFSKNFLTDWLSSFLLCVLVMAPLGGGISYLLHKLVSNVFGRFSELKRNIIFALLMAIFMESIMAIVTVTNNIGFINIEHFASAWLNAFLLALPIGMCFSILVSTTIKPRLEQYFKS